MISLATKQARKSSFKQRIGAVIVKGGRLISVGFNQVGKTNPNHKTWDSSRHAEEDAILKRLSIRDGLSSLANSTLYVSRVKANGTPGLAKPCVNCERLARAVGIRKVVYTTDTGETETYHLTQM